MAIYEPPKPVVHEHVFEVEVDRDGKVDANMLAIKHKDAIACIDSAIGPIRRTAIATELSIGFVGFKAQEKTPATPTETKAGDVVLKVRLMAYADERVQQSI